jgi:hypothetical protein
VIDFQSSRVTSLQAKASWKLDSFCHRLATVHQGWNIESYGLVRTLYEHYNMLHCLANSARDKVLGPR